MNNIKKFFVTFMGSLLLLSSSALPAIAAAPWNVTGNYEATFFLDPDVSTTPYTHHVTLVQSGSAVTGNGGYPATGGDTYHWNVTSGTQTANSLNLTALYDIGAPGTVMHMTGNIAANGTVTGVWDDNFGGMRTGTWSITKGVSVPRIHTPANNAIVTQSALVKIDWTDSIGSNPPFMYQYKAYSDAGYTSLVYDSGMVLSSSEIPTPGTPPGDYYVTVSAQNAALTMSAWSNGASNPYHIKVIADPINPFPVPAQCDQSIAYNKIEGNSGANNINGTSGNDLILAKGGADRVDGKGGNDCIDGGDGADVLNGGTGNDVLLGGDGADLLYGDDGMDRLYGENNADVLSGGNNDDYLDGGANADRANGENGTDTCTAEVETSCEL